jgi:L-malate glycosyltransferase
MTAIAAVMAPAAAEIPVLMLARVLDNGGIERDVSKFSRHIGIHGIRPHVACFNEGGMRWQEIKDAGIDLVTVPVKSFRSRSAIDGASQLRRYVHEHGIRLIHAFDVPADIFAVPLAGLFGVPVLSSQLCYRDLCSTSTKAILTVIDRLAAGVFVNCEGIAKHMRTDWRVTSGRIHICHNGYEPAEFNPYGRKRIPELAEASTVIGTVALLRPEKNLDLLIEAFAQVHKADGDARLLIVGSGPLKEKLVAKACALNVQSACVFREAVSQPAEYMRSIDIFALPSSSEGFSNSLLEAMACGCCPVASRIGGLPELIPADDYGLLFELGSVEQLATALRRLVQNPEERKNKAQSAARYVEQNFTMVIAAAKLAEIYRAILARRPSTHLGATIG